MEKAVTTSLQKLHLNLDSNSKLKTLQPPQSHHRRTKPRKLVSLCLGVLGKHLEDIIADLGDLAATFPADIKMAITAIARRRKLLNDDVLISLAESSWEILDISGSEVSDFGLAKVSEICRSLRAIDISHCSKITAVGVSELVQHCRSLEILRCGGCPRSEFTARRCVGILIPNLYNVEGESWEELDTVEIANGSESLRWLIWPKIDDNSKENLVAGCPRIVVNPKWSPFGFRGVQVPREALPDIILDDSVVEDIDPQTWEVCGPAPRAFVEAVSSPTELHIAEKFRLAFLERDNRLAPKRAKNARQHRRRAEKEWVMSTDAKSIAIASKLNESLRDWS